MRLIIMLLLLTGCDKITAKVTNEDPMASFTFRGYTTQEVEVHIKPAQNFVYYVMTIPAPFPYERKPKAAVTAEKEPSP